MKKGEKKEEEIKENKDEKIWDKIKKFFKDVLSLVKNVIFILSLLKRSIVYFSLQIVQSYLKLYQQHNFQNADEDLIVLFYSIATLASTALGGLMSGIITKKLGGYENKKSIYVIIIPEIITGITVAFLTFTKNFYVYNVNLIIYFCFISMGTPVLQGYLIQKIPKSIKGIGVGLDIIAYTFFRKISGAFDLWEFSW